MADADNDHRPRIVAVIPKKMRVVHLDATESKQMPAAHREPNARCALSSNSNKANDYKRKESGGTGDNACTVTTKWTESNCKNNRLVTGPSNNPLSAHDSRGAYVNGSEAGVAHAEPAPTTTAHRIGGANERRSEQRENNSPVANSPHQQKRVQPVEHDIYVPKGRVRAGQSLGKHDVSDERDGRPAQVRVIIRSVSCGDEDANMQINASDKESRALQLRREYWYDKDSVERNLVGLCKDLGAAKRNMATLSPKSPKPAVAKTDKEESIWDKIGTLGRKKRIKEVQEVQEEGKHAIDSPGLPHFPTTSPEDYDLEENEERCMIDQSVYTNPHFIKLVNVLINWINDELASQRIIVQDLAEDLYDGQVLQKLLEKLTGDKLDVREVTQSEEGQKQKLHAVLSHFNHVLGLSRTGSKKWNVEAIHSKNIVSIMHLLVALARHFRPPVRLTEHVSVPVIIVKKVGGRLDHRTVTEVITTSYDDVGLRWERDAIDSLFDHAPEKLQMVKKSLVTFVNKHLAKTNFEVTEIESQFHDGVYLIFLMGLLEGFFVPLHAFHSTPKDFEQKVHNVSFAFELMEEVGITKLKARPEDIVNQDLKSTLRVLYTLFIRYRSI